jgi:hypothetical protein
MEKIVVSKVNDVFLHIECEGGARQELADYFTFYVPGYKFMPAFKNKMWDGKIRLYDLRAHTLYVGLLDYVKKFADERGYEVQINFQHTITKVNEEDLATFVTKFLHLPFEPRDYQYRAATHGLRHRRTLLVSPTASGKSLIIYLLLRFYMGMLQGKRLLLIVPTTSLVEQMRTDFLGYAQNDDSFDDSMIHTIYSGKEKDTLAPIVITT